MSQVHMAQSACYHDTIGCISHGTAIRLQAVRLTPIAELARAIITNSQHWVRDAIRRMDKFVVKRLRRPGECGVR